MSVEIGDEPTRFVPRIPSVEMEPTRFPAVIANDPMRNPPAITFYAWLCAWFVSWFAKLRGYVSNRFMRAPADEPAREAGPAEAEGEARPAASANAEPLQVRNRLVRTSHAWVGPPAEAPARPLLPRTSYAWVGPPVEAVQPMLPGNLPRC